MKVSIKSKMGILKSFLSWLPLAVASSIFYGAIFSLLIMWLLTGIVGIEEALARKISWVLTPILLALCAYAYLVWLVSSLSSYWLSIKGDNLKVMGRSGWRALNIEMPIGEIEMICIGGSASSAEKLALDHSAVQDQIHSRLAFFPRSGRPFNLDFATKAFDVNSLHEFLVFAKSKGVETNFGV